MSIQTIATTIKQFNNQMYIQELFDPVQTHAVYGVHKDEVADIKATLKQAGANRFRVVAAGMKDYKIVCFKVK